MRIVKDLLTKYEPLWQAPAEIKVMQQAYLPGKFHIHIFVLVFWSFWIILCSQTTKGRFQSCCFNTIEIIHGFDSGLEEILKTVQELGADAGLKDIDDKFQAQKDALASSRKTGSKPSRAARVVSQEDSDNEDSQSCSSRSSSASSPSTYSQTSSVASNLKPKFKSSHKSATKVRIKKEKAGDLFAHDNENADLTNTFRVDYDDSETLLRFKMLEDLENSPAEDPTSSPERDVFPTVDNMSFTERAATSLPVAPAGFFSQPDTLHEIAPLDSYSQMIPRYQATPGPTFQYPQVMSNYQPTARVSQVTSDQIWTERSFRTLAEPEDTRGYSTVPLVLSLGSSRGLSSPQITDPSSSQGLWSYGNPYQMRVSSVPFCLPSAPPEKPLTSVKVETQSPVAKKSKRSTSNWFSLLFFG